MTPSRTPTPLRMIWSPLGARLPWDETAPPGNGPRPGRPPALFAIVGSTARHMPPPGAAGAGPFDLPRNRFARMALRVRTRGVERREAPAWGRFDRCTPRDGVTAAGFKAGAWGPPPQGG